ncbi:MAG: DUF87 domain-containing protein [Clostridiales bacterium]|nr:DUF87 domain-containing protein [Clostridiales bacterium]
MTNGFTSADKNSALCRKELDSIPHGNFVSTGYEECRDMQFFKVCGLTRFWEFEKDFQIGSLMADILSSCIRYGVPFAYAIIGDENGINIYVGTMKLLLGSLKASYQSMFPGIDIERVNDNPLRTAPNQFGGLFTGLPTNKIEQDKKSFQIENICRGMNSKKFTYVILASGLSSNAVSFGHERILQEMEHTYALINQTIIGGAQGNITAQKQDFHCKNYFENLEILEEIIKVGVARGMWRMNGYYASDNQIDAKQLGNIVKATFSGKDSKPDSFRLIEYNSIKEVIPNSYMMADTVINPGIHPLGSWSRAGLTQNINLFVYKFQTILNSEQLATLCQLPTKEFSGFYIDEYVEFDVSNRIKDSLQEPIAIGDICIAGRKNVAESTNKYLIEKNDFTRHALIVGITGGGKTNTSKSILDSLWNTDKKQDRIPFMVIESAKREYWEMRNLRNYEDILVFTLGAEATNSSVKYRINPFETNPKVSLQTHIDYLLTTFKAAFDLYPPLPYILEKAVYEIYSDRGWDIVESSNRYGLKEYPTLTDLYNKIDYIVENLGYHHEIKSNVKAALQARIYSLMIGGKGAMLNTPKSVPIEELLSRPVIMELEDLGDDETKSFVIGLLLVQLYEHRKSQVSKGSKKLSHVLLVEEAHRLLKKVTEIGEGASSRAKSIEFFCNLLAEIRTFGQGIIISEQIPTKLASDTIKNTNLKIVHRTVAREDREEIGFAMNMSQEQIEYLSSLRRGYAAVYAEGDNRPKCLKIPLLEPFYTKERDEVIAEVRKKVHDIAKDYDKIIYHHSGCSFCEHRCKYYERISSLLGKRVDINKVLEKIAARKFSAKSIAAFLESQIIKELELQNDFESRCAIGYILHKDSNLNDGQRQKIIADYLRYIYESKED